MILQANIPLKPMDEEVVNTTLKRAQHKATDAHQKVGVFIDLESLPNNAKVTLSDGDTLPEVMFYWAKLSAEVNNYAIANNKHACWFDISNRQEYELSTDTLIELLNNTFLWENNTLDLALIWCNINEFNIFGRDMSFDGLIIPIDSGLGLVSSLNEPSYKALSMYFE